MRVLVEEVVVFSNLFSENKRCWRADRFTCCKFYHVYRGVTLKFIHAYVGVCYRVIYVCGFQPISTWRYFQYNFTVHCCWDYII